MGSRPNSSDQSIVNPVWPAEDEVLLDLLQRAAFAYFPEQLNRDNGLVADT